MSAEQVRAETAAFMRKVYLFMSAGLAATGVTAMIVAGSEAAVRFILLNRAVFYGLLIVEVLMVLGFVALVKRMSAIGAGVLFFSYAIVSGLTFSVIFLVYTMSSIATTFYVTAGTFAATSAVGYVTKRDLSGVGHFCIMGLIGLIIASVVNLFVASTQLYWLTTYAGVIIFVGLTAYDTQKIKQLNVIGNAGTDEDHKEAIHGALVLYLDFINLFLYLLRLFGRRR
ncbi:MAG: Bax inhibitor-1/YccA family protein [Deltaproteobacteria bacterium]|nr:Bax inhibitor-1/YccA family protein [Deltaproteobacteria bacterium]